MIAVGEALSLVLRDVPHLGSEQVALPNLCGRILSHELRATRDVPPYRNSAMDGFAVRGEDLASAPVVLRVLETVAAGSVPSLTVQPDTATRIMTGAMMPDGADTVVRVEDTSEDAESVRILVAPRTGSNVRSAGEDIRSGEIVFEHGRILRPADVGILASLGVSIATVVRRPRVAILSTGDELLEPGQLLAPGKIVNSNAYTLAAAVEENRGLATVLPVAADSRDALGAALSEAFRADVVLTTGGVSAGKFDYVRDVLQSHGYEERFWKVAQKPGKPLTYGLRDDTPVFGLPGNPVSTLVCFYVYVLPLLRSMMGLSDIHLPLIDATLADPISKSAGITEFVRCSLDSTPRGVVARSTGTQSSGVLRSMSLGDGLIVLPPTATRVEAGQAVRAIRVSANSGGTERCA